MPFNWKIAIKLYRGILLIVTHVFFIGLNTYGWSSSGVNHVLIFEIDPRNHLVYQELLEVSILCLIENFKFNNFNFDFKIGTFLGVLWMINIIAYTISAYLSIEYSFYPIIFVLFLLIYLINPIRIMKQSARFWLIKILVNKILTFKIIK